MNTLTKKDKLALQVSLALVAGMFSLIPVANGAPVIDRVVSGGAIVNNYSKEPQTHTTVKSSNQNNVINWKDFSIGENESVVFDDGAKTHDYLNVVTGNGTSYINGTMRGGNHVYLVNPHGVIMDEKAKIDVGNLYVSTRDLTNIDMTGANLSDGESVLTSQAGKLSGEVVNMGKIQANHVYVEGTGIRFTNTKNVQYKALTDVTDTTASNLPVMGKDNAGTVSLYGTDYVHVGYEATASLANKSDVATHYKTPNEEYSASALKYTINGSSKTASSFNNGINDYDYALVRNDHELQAMNSNLKINYMLMQDINLSTNYSSSNPFKPIGGDSEAFKGNFDGNFYTVKNLYNETASGYDPVKNPEAGHQYTGLFGRAVGENYRTSIMNVGVENVHLMARKGGGYAGGIAGFIDNVRLENVYNKASSTDNRVNAQNAGNFTINNTDKYSYFDSKVGGVLGGANNSVIKNVYNTGTVINGAGLVGELKETNITNAYNAGTVRNSKDYIYGTTTLEQHYAIVDSIDEDSKVGNVYGSGSYGYKVMSSSSTAPFTPVSSLALSPNTSNFTNSYEIDSSTQNIVEKYGDDESANYWNNNKSYNLTNASGKSAANFGFFGAKKIGDKYVAKSTSTDDWRIYEGQSLPLLRSFLKYGKEKNFGTVPVSFTLSLYKQDKGEEYTHINDYISDEVTYNGYYVGASSVNGDTSRGITSTSGISYSDGRIKNVGDSTSAVYATGGQDGYDIADSTITIKARNLVPDGKFNLTKIYDGKSDATEAMRKAISSSDNAIDVGEIYKNGGIVNGVSVPKHTLIETGLVKTYDAASGNMKAETVSLNKNAVASATYYEHGTDVYDSIARNSANTVKNVREARNADNAAAVYVVWNDANAIQEGAYSSNYTFDSTAFNREKRTINGIIAPRPVYMKLQETTGINKVYDSTNTVVYKGKNSTWTDATDNVQFATDEEIAAAIRKKEGLAEDAKVTVEAGFLDNEIGEKNLETPYYTTGSGTGTVPNAGEGYTANYAVSFTGTGNFDADNYAVYNYDSATKTLGTSAVAQDDAGRYLLTGTGNIEKRTVYADKAEFGNIVNGEFQAVTEFTKVYDNSSDYDGVTAMDFATKGTVSVDDAVNQVSKTGIIEGQEGAFTAAFTLADNKFYNVTGTTATEDSQITANTMRFGITVDPDKDTDKVLQNYQLKLNENSNEIYKLDGTENIYIDETGSITKRKVYLTLNQNTINKTYDGDASFKDDTNNIHYYEHTDDDAKGNVTYLSNAPIDYENKKIADGTTWNIEGTYKAVDTEGDQNVYKVDGTVKNKKIEYKVNLKNGADDNDNHKKNYILYVSDGNGGYVAFDQENGEVAEFKDVSGKIKPVTISEVEFGYVSKKYDGTDKVGEVNGKTQTGNYIVIENVYGDKVDNNGNKVSALVNGETLQTVFGTAVDADTGKYTATNADNAITGTYLAPAGLTYGGAHAYDMDGDGTGEERNVEYKNLSKAVISDNYEMKSDTQSGEGRIDSLTITTLSPTIAGKAEKVYDGTNNIIGTDAAPTYQVAETGYNDDGTVKSEDAVKKLTSTNVKSDLINKITGGNESENISGVELIYTVNGDSYFAKDDSSLTPTANVTEAKKAVYSITVKDTQYGDYSLGEAKDGTYKNAKDEGGNIIKGVALISGEGKITPRHVFAEGVKQDKPYDGDETGGRGDAAVKLNPQDGWTDVTGVVGSVTNKSTADYSADADGYRNKDANYNPAANDFFREDAKTVSYVAKLESGNDNYAFYYENTGADSSTVKWKAGNTFDDNTKGHIIRQKDLTVDYDKIIKVYDGSDNVFTNSKGTVTTENPNPLPDNYVYGQPKYTPLTGDEVIITSNSDTSQFLETNGLASSYAGDHDVRYDLDISGTDYYNYHLVGGTNISVYTDDDGKTHATATGKGHINKAEVSGVSIDFADITKVYDGNTNVGYTHTDGYDSTQTGSKEAKDFVNPTGKNNSNAYSFALDGYSKRLEYGTDYSILSALYNSADVNTNNNVVTYTFVINNQELLQNVNLDFLGGNLETESDNTAKYTFTYNNNGTLYGTINPKNIYASLTNMATDSETAPKKVYNGSRNVVTNTDSDPVGTAWTTGTLNTYMTVEGLVNNTAQGGNVKDTYTISALYESRDVAGDNGSTVDYTATVTNSGNYNLYTRNAEGKIVNADGEVVNAAGVPDENTATNNVLKGIGTIKPKNITFEAGYTEKTYDHETNVTGNTEATYAFSNTANGEELTPDAGSIVGNYVVKSGTGASDYTPNADVAATVSSEGKVTVNYKAVQYDGLNVALANAAGKSATDPYTGESYTASGANYVINKAVLKDERTNDDGVVKAAGTKATSFSNTGTGTAVYGADLANGKITRRALKATDIEASWTDEAVVKTYDTSSDVINPTKYFSIHTIKDSTGGVSYELDYDYRSAKYTKNGSEVSDAGKNYVLSYVLDGLSGNTAINYSIDGLVDYSGTFNSNDTSRATNTTTGTIKPYVITGTVKNGYRRIYDGGYTADPSYFTFSDADEAFLRSDHLLGANESLSSLVKVEAAFANNDKTANVDPDATTDNHKTINYTLSYRDSSLANNGNYVLATDGSDKDEYDIDPVTYTGTGDIERRKVYVQDDGGDVYTKTYDGSKDLPSNANLQGRFSLVGSGDTGLIAEDKVSLKDLSVSNAKYVSTNVARNSDGQVINTGVKYSGFALQNDDATDDVNNYYLVAENGTAALKDGTVSNVTVEGSGSNLTITEDKGGLIKPKQVILSINSPEKTYDATTEVEAADKAGSNLSAKADRQDVSKHFDSANNAVFELHPGTGQDDVTVEITGASYDTKDVSYDENGKGNKVTTFNISWHNGNYDFVSETEENGDTFEEKSYSASNGKVNRTGELKDHTSTINPLELHISSMNATKTYDGNPYYSYTGSGSSNGLNVSFGDADAVIQKDINMSDNTALNNVDFLGMTANGIYGEATDAAVAAVTEARDAAKDENSAPFTHKMEFSNIAIDGSNPNYQLVNSSFAYSDTNTNSTGTINRATVTATPKPKYTSINSGGAMPDYTGTLSGFYDNDTPIAVTTTTYVYDDEGNVTDTIEETQNVSVADYYAGKFNWGPNSNVTNRSVGTNPVYGWYRTTVTVNGEEVERIYKEGNLGKNYTLVQDPGVLEVKEVYYPGSDSPVTKPSTAPVPATTPVVVTPTTTTVPSTAAPATTAPAVEPVSVIPTVTDYVEKPITPDSSVYQNVSKDNSQSSNRNAVAAIQYGNSVTSSTSNNGESGSSGTIGIEVAEVVNLLGGDVASDGTMSLTNTGDGQALSVESTENGYLSVGSAGSEGSIGIETEGGIVSADNGEREGTIGLETEGSLLNADNGEKEGTISLESEEGVLNANGTDKEGTIGLETEDEVLLDTEQGKELLSTTSSDEESGTTKEGSISIKSSSKDGEAEITSAGSRLAKADEVQKKDEDKDKEDEEEKNSEEESNKEGEAAIAYSDVA